MSQNFRPGDFLVFQLEAGFALLRLLDITDNGGEKTWHVAAYGDFYPDVESAESAALRPETLEVTNPHIALTTRAFESTQVARLGNLSLNRNEIEGLENWKQQASPEVSDRSVRLMLGIR